MNIYQKKYQNKLLQTICKCRSCSDSDDKTIGEPANIGCNYGKNVRILFIGHNPKKDSNEIHNTRKFRSYGSFKYWSDREANIEDDWGAISTYLKKFTKQFGYHDLSGIAFTNIVKCQKKGFKRGMDDNKNIPSQNMYKNCIHAYLSEEITILDPDIIVLLGEPANKSFYKFFLEKDKPEYWYSQRKIYSILGKKRIILGSYHPTARGGNDKIDKWLHKGVKYAQEILGKDELSH